MQWFAPFALRVMIIPACLIFGSDQILSKLSAAESPYRWDLITAKAEFAPRDGAGALSYRGRMWLLGG